MSRIGYRFSLLQSHNNSCIHKYVSQMVPSLHWIPDFLNMSEVFGVLPFLFYLWVSCNPYLLNRQELAFRMVRRHPLPNDPYCSANTQTNHHTYIKSCYIIHPSWASRITQVISRIKTDILKVDCFKLVSYGLVLFVEPTDKGSLKYVPVALGPSGCRG